MPNSINTPSLIEPIAVRFGPFKTEHFLKQADAAFEAHFLEFVRKQLVPLAKGISPTVSGEVMAAYDAENYLGPNSLLRFCYEYEIVFRSAQGEEAMSGVADYSPSTGLFSNGESIPTYSSFEERAAYLKKCREGEALTERYKNGERSLSCPRCGKTPLNLSPEDTYVGFSCIRYFGGCGAKGAFTLI